MTTVIYDNWDACWNGCPTDSGDKCFCVHSARADADSFGIGRKAQVTDIDIVFARGDMKPGCKPDSDVVAAGGVVGERVKTDSRVLFALRVAHEREHTVGREIVAGG